MPTLEPTRHHCKQILAANVLREHGRIRIAALGVSMLPSVWPGDVLTVERERVDNIEKGEIVLWERDGRFVAHRVSRRISAPGNTCLVTRGDALSHEDEPVTSRELLGKVVSVERAGRCLPEVPKCSSLRRGWGRLLSSWDRLRSLALRWHRWRCGPRLKKCAESDAARYSQAPEIVC